MSFELPQLPYAYSALEPHIDARTMEIHHSKHHAAYTNNLNAALENSHLLGKSIEDVMVQGMDTPAIRNNGGGFYNHNLFWEIMTPGGSNAPEGDLLNAINEAFGSIEGFKDAFAKAATTRFGSGWAWLCVHPGGKVEICSTPNQDNPLMDIAEVKGFPILGLDVWEHAYYLKYQNKRPDYINNWWNLVNWEFVQKRYDEANH